MKTSKNIKAYNLFRQYERATETSIFQCYVTRPSIYKEAAENEILQRMQDENGHGYRILSHNGFMFVCGYLVEKDGEKWLVIDTKSDTKRILVDGEYSGKGTVWYN